MVRAGGYGDFFFPSIFLVFRNVIFNFLFIKVTSVSFNKGDE